jgi:hypothetical protein
LTKALVVRLWKPELEAFGFVFRNGLFRYRSREEGHLDLAVSVQRNTRSETYKINPSILLRNTLLESAPSELLVLANLRVDGIFLHVTRSSWWPPEALADALRALQQHVIGWYHRVGRIDYLAAVAETAIREKASLVDVIEPMDRSATALPWAPDTPLRLGSALFYHAAVLHYLNGDRDQAIARTRDWLAAVPARDGAERTRAQEQLDALGRAS